MHAFARPTWDGSIFKFRRKGKSIVTLCNIKSKLKQVLKKYFPIFKISLNARSFVFRMVAGRLHVKYEWTYKPLSNATLLNVENVKCGPSNFYFMHKPTNLTQSMLQFQSLSRATAHK